MNLHTINLNEEEFETLRRANLQPPSDGVWRGGKEEGQALLVALLEETIQVSRQAQYGHSDPSFAQYHRHLRKLLLRIANELEDVPRTLALELQSIEPFAVNGGSFGDVHEGMLDDQKVAVKCLRIFLSDSEEEKKKKYAKLRREMLMWRPLTHASILPLLGFTYVGDRLAMVSPWMPHGDVLAFIRAKNESVDYLLLRIAQGLKYLHSLDLIHGDLRSANILVDNDGAPRLADFGLAVAYSTSAPAGSSNIGSPRWTAPEDLASDRDGNDTPATRRPASDIYSFACLVIELYTLSKPFPEINEYMVPTHVLNGNRPLRPDAERCAGRAMSDRVWQLVNKCWAHDPDERPSASQVVADLTAAMMLKVDIPLFDPSNTHSPDWPLGQGGSTSPLIDSENLDASCNYSYTPEGALFGGVNEPSDSAVSLSESKPPTPALSTSPRSSPLTEDDDATLVTPASIFTALKADKSSRQPIVGVVDPNTSSLDDAPPITERPQPMPDWNERDMPPHAHDLNPDGKRDALEEEVRSLRRKVERYSEALTSNGIPLPDM